MQDEAITVDVAALSRRYEEERRKRIRDDGMAQFHRATGQFAHLGADPRADADFTRDPIAAENDVLIIGGGLAGLLAGARLTENGVNDVRYVDIAGDFGGTWYWNRYPAARCDIDAYVYMPLLEETGYVPTEKYAGAVEIFEHARRIAKHYGFYDQALFQTGVTGLAWNEDAARWLVETDRGDRISARFVVACKGLYTNPKLPNIPGIDSFTGTIFHTSRWNYDYTGGDEDGRLTRLADKTVGIIGTGSTGIQAVVPLAEWSKQLYLFQRTPSSIDVRGNCPTDPEWKETLQPGWHRQRMENFTKVTAGIEQKEDLVNDSWTDILRKVGSTTAGNELGNVDPEDITRAQMVRMEQVRRRIDSIVKDKATAEALKPWYFYFCKRPGFSDQYLDVFNQPNVELVDTAGRGVERVTPTGVIAGGEEYPLDCLVLATGFEFMTNYTVEAGFDPIGRGGLRLSQHWSDGARTLFGMHVHHFPNFFMISLVQAGISMNYTHTAEEQAAHIAHVIGRAKKEGIRSVEASAEAEQGWVDLILSNAPARRAFLDSCTPSYFNYEGKRERAYEQNEPYPNGPVAYYDLLQNWRRDGKMSGLNIE